MGELLFLRSIKFKAEHRCFGKGDSFTFRPGLNLLTGDQGCGKSTLLNCLMNDNDSAFEIDVDPAEFIFFDSEKHNPRVKTSIEFDDDVEGTLNSFFVSHGETLLPRMEGIINFKNRIIFLDEPESALSIRSQIKVAKALSKTALKNQIFVCTHSPYIIREADQVLDIERRKWADSEEFIKYQENGRSSKKK